MSDAELRNVPSKKKTIIQLYLDITDILAVFFSLIRYIKVFHITSPQYNERSQKLFPKKLELPEK